MVLTVSSVLSLVSRALLPPSPARSSPHGFDISVGMSGPHDFAVRFTRVRLRAEASTASRTQRSWRSRNAPLLWARDREGIAADLEFRSTAADWHDGQISLLCGKRVKGFWRSCRCADACRHCEEQGDEAIQIFFTARFWIASRSLSSGAHSRDPLARNDAGKQRRGFSSY